MVTSESLTFSPVTFPLSSTIKKASTCFGSERFKTFEMFKLNSCLMNVDILSFCLSQPLFSFFGLPYFYYADDHSYAPTDPVEIATIAS